MLSRKGSGVKPQNGRVAATRQAGLEARLAIAEAAAEAARMQLLEAAERAEAAQGHIDKYLELQTEHQVPCRQSIEMWCSRIEWVPYLRLSSFCMQDLARDLVCPCLSLENWSSALFRI